jgi:hypothetical protein
MEHVTPRLNGKLAITQDRDAPEIGDGSFIRGIARWRDFRVHRGDEAVALRAVTASGENDPCGKTITRS